MPSVVLDASAVLAVLNGEPGADVVLAEIDNAVMSTVNYAEVASKLIGFANRFGDNGYKGDVCAPSYDQFFAETLPLIDTACQNYEPPK